MRRRQLYSAAGPGPEPEIVPDIEDNQEEEGDNQDNAGQCHMCEMLQQVVHRLRLERDSYKDKLSKLSISSENFIVTENDAASQIERRKKLWTAIFCCVYLDFELNCTAYFRKKGYLQGESTSFNFDEAPTRTCPFRPWFPIWCVLCICFK